MAAGTRDIEQRRDAVIAEFGPWTAYNIHLGEGVYTMGSAETRMAEERVARTVRHVCDLAGRPLGDLRVLDLGAYEGGFAIELARRGAEVVAVEGRKGHVAKARFAGEVLGLDRLTVIHEDIRRLGPLELGTFDVVLCLGVLYHLGAEDALALARDVAAHCTRFAVIETQVGLTDTSQVTLGGHTYHGRSYREDLRAAGASIGNEESFWPTRASLFNLLSDAAFTSIFECVTPVIPSVAAYEDHVTLIAVPGESGGEEPVRWPEQLERVSHPSQGVRHRLRERLRRRSGGGLPAVFRGARG